MLFERCKRWSTLNQIWAYVVCVFLPNNDAGNSGSTKLRKYETTKVRNNESAKPQKCETTTVRDCETTKVRCETTKLRNCERAKERCETTKGRCETTKLRKSERAMRNSERAMRNNERAMRNNERAMRNNESAKQRNCERARWPYPDTIDCSWKLIILVIIGTTTSSHFLNRHVGMVSSSHDFTSDFRINSLISSVVARLYALRQRLDGITTDSSLIQQTENICITFVQC